MCFRCLENDVLKSKRLLVKTNPAPKWTTKVSKNDTEKHLFFCKHIKFMFKALQDVDIILNVRQ